MVGAENEPFRLDNFQSGFVSNISHLLDCADFELIQHDIVEPINLVVDEIFNLACPASPPVYQASPIHTIKTNVIGALNLLELASNLNIPIFQASTSEVYDDPLCSPQVENYWETRLS